MSWLNKIYTSNKEKKYLFLIIIIFLIINNLSFITAMAVENPDYFTGYNYFAGGDKTVYLSQIEQARQGHILFKNLYTSEPQQGLIFSPLWLVFGSLGKLANVSNVLILEVGRILLGVLFILFVYKFISHCFASYKQRLFTLLMLCFSSGLGIFTYNVGLSEWEKYNYFGTDLWVSEGNTFLTLRHSALFIVSQLLIVLIFWWQIQRLKNAKWPEVVFLGLVVLFLGIIHPYDLVIISSVSAVWLITEFLRHKKWSWPLFLKEAYLFLMVLAAIFYFCWLKNVEPSFAGWAKQNITVSPGFYNYAIGYGFIFLLFLFGIYSSVKSKNKYLRFVGIWAIVHWFLLFLPLPVQRRFANALHVCMIIIATVGFVNIVGYLKNKIAWLYHSYIFRILSAFVLITGFVITNLFNIIQETMALPVKGFPSFVSVENYKAINWLKANLDQTNVVLSGKITGNVLPSITGGLVFIGHGHQTINWDDKLLKTEQWFFKNNEFDVKKEEWLKNESIDYLYWGDEEKALGNFEPEQKKYLKKIFENTEVKIFKVI